MAAAEDKKIGRILLEAEHITKAQLDEALAIQKGSGRPLGEILVEQGHVTRTHVLTALSAQLGIRPVRLSEHQVDLQLVRKVPRAFPFAQRVIPLREERDRVLVAMKRPNDEVVLGILDGLFEKKVAPLLADAEEIAAALRLVYGEAAPRQPPSLRSRTLGVDAGEVRRERRRGLFWRVVGCVVLAVVGFDLAVLLGLETRRRDWDREMARALPREVHVQRKEKVEAGRSAAGRASEGPAPAIASRSPRMDAATGSRVESSRDLAMGLEHMQHEKKQSQAIRAFEDFLRKDAASPRAEAVRRWLRRLKAGGGADPRGSGPGFAKRRYFSTKP